MPEFVRRVGFADKYTNPYYNEPQYVGKTGGVISCGGDYECVNFCIGRSCELAETEICYWSWAKHKDEILYPIFNRSGYGNAIEFVYTNWDKTTKGAEVRLGDILIYGTSWGYGEGHVRVVEAIDNDYLILSGGNEDGKGEVKFDIRQKIVDTNPNGTGLLYYVHNPYLTFNQSQVSEEENEYKKLYEDLRKEHNAYVDEVKQVKNNIIKELERI